MTDRASSKPESHRAPRELLRWLLLVPIAFLIVFGCSQLALNSVVYPPAPDTHSQLRADYGAWPMVMVPALNPAIIEDIRRDENLNATVIARPFWPVTDRPAATSPPTSIAQKPTSAPVLPTGTPTLAFTPTATPQPTRTATSYPTRTPRSTATSTAWATSTETPWPTATPWPPRAATRTHTPAPVTSPPVTPTRTSTPTPTSSFTPTATFTPSSTPTRTSAPTDTLTPTDTATPTSTATSTSTPTITPQPCTGSYPPGEPNAGLPNGTIVEVACGGELTIDLAGLSLPHITTHGDADYDLVYYEYPSCSGICLDWVQVDVCDTLPCPAWLTVFNWGDDIPDTNTNVAAYSAGGELDNKDIPSSALLDSTGITIDVDAFGPSPSGGYRYVRLRSPINWPNNDGAQVDSIEIVP